MKLTDNNNKSDQRVKQRRTGKDRRAIVRFGNALGRRSVLERRSS